MSVSPGGCPGGRRAGLGTNDGATSYASIWELRPDVVMMGVRRPGMDGIAATHRIRADCPEVVVIGLVCQRGQFPGDLHDRLDLGQVGHAVEVKHDVSWLKSREVAVLFHKLLG
jgi:CheY-like chemotaxis protein